MEIVSPVAGPWDSPYGAHARTYVDLAAGGHRGVGHGECPAPLLFGARRFAPLGGDAGGWFLTGSSEGSGSRVGSRLGGDPRVSRAGRALNREDTEQLKHFERRLQRRPGLGEHLRRQSNRSKPRLRALVHATWYVLLAAAVVSTIYHLLVI